MRWLALRADLDYALHSMCIRFSYVGKCGKAPCQSSVLASACKSRMLSRPWALSGDSPPIGLKRLRLLAWRPVRGAPKLRPDDVADVVMGASCLREHLERLSMLRSEEVLASIAPPRRNRGHRVLKDTRQCAKTMITDGNVSTPYNEIHFNQNDMHPSNIAFEILMWHITCGKVTQRVSSCTTYV